MERKLPDGWKQVLFSDIARIERDAISGEDIPIETFYVGLEHIEKDTGRLIKDTTEEQIILKSNKFKFNEKHILYGKLRPYLNKVWLADREGVCSTDIIPILPDESKMSREFLYELIPKL
jgi:type I restriction enzyme S subunit